MESLGPFTILERLGGGVLGELFRARDTRHGRTVALRVVAAPLAADATTRDALLADARRVQPLAHPNIAALLDIVEQDGRLLLVHELAVGQPLSTLTGGHVLAPALAVRVAAQVADAIAAGAARGIPHGALDPADIVVGAEGRVKILDYGMARWTTHGAERRAAEGLADRGDLDVARVVRAAGRLSPEQLLGAAGDARADVFALGVILYEMLTGSGPFAAASPRQAAGATVEEDDPVAATTVDVLRTTPAPPSRLNAGVPPALDAIVLRALAKSLEARYPGGQEMAADLRALSFAPADLPSMPALRPRSGRRARAARRRRILLASGLALIVLLAAASWFLRDRLVGGAPDAGPALRPVVLVLPFAVGGDNPRDYYGPGFAEDVAGWLSEIPNTSVVGRTGIRALDARAEWRVRARKLDASIVVTGTVRHDQDQVEADVEVLDATTGASIWSEHFRREAGQIAGLPAEIAGRLAAHLGMPTPVGNRWARAPERAVDPVAYGLYLEGRDAAARRDRSRAIALYDQALQRDPRLVEARASLSQSLYLEEYYAGGLREPSTGGRALREAEAALAADPELASAHIAAALAAQTTTTAASSLSRALAFDPSNGEAWHYAGDLIGDLDPQRAVGFYRTSLRLEPSLDANWRDIASAQAMAGDFAQAERSLVSGEAVRPDRAWWRQMRARLDMQQGRYDQAVQSMLADPAVESTPIAWLMGRVIPLSMTGRAGDAQREATRIGERYPGFCEGRAVLAGAEIDAGTPDRGRNIAAQILAEASRTGADPGLLGCAALAAASTGDAAETAGWLSKVAADERALRIWTRQAIFGVGLSFRLRWYPWTKVLGKQPVQVAAGQLEQALTRVRDEAERRLPEPPPPGR